MSAAVNNGNMDEKNVLNHPATGESGTTVSIGHPILQYCHAIGAQESAMHPSGYMTLPLKSVEQPGNLLPPVVGRALIMEQPNSHFIITRSSALFSDKAACLLIRWCLAK